MFFRRNKKNDNNECEKLKTFVESHNKLVILERNKSSAVDSLIGELTPADVFYFAPPGSVRVTTVLYANLPSEVWGRLLEIFNIKEEREAIYITKEAAYSLKKEEAEKILFSKC
jgi:hypothetical protein